MDFVRTASSKREHYLQVRILGLGDGGGHFLVDGVVQANNQEIDVTAAQLAQVTYQSGSGADTLQMKVFDGTQWSELVDSLHGNRTGRHRSCHRGLEPHGGAWSKLYRVEPVRL